MFPHSDAMKFKYLLLFAASALLLKPAPIESFPAKVAYETRTVATSSTQVYQQANPAVVTVFAGREIGSGSIVSADGLVITNNHVIRGNTQVFVRMADGQRIAGQVIATDGRADLALIQLNGGSSFPTIAFASQAPRGGQAVFAIGSPYGQPGVMTTGTFTRSRSNGDLQSLVELKPGNSGGPLLNAQGQMVGVNKAILESAQGSNTGISIATSAATARQFIERNRPGGLVASAPGQWAGGEARSPVPDYAPNFAVGAAPRSQRNYATGENGRSRYATKGNPVIIAPNGQRNTPFYEAGGALPAQRYDNLLTTVPPATRGSGVRLGVMIDARTLIIQQVEAGSAAANSGLRSGDRVVGINGNQLNNLGQLQQLIQQAPNRAAFVVERYGQAQTVMVQF